MRVRGLSRVIRQEEIAGFRLSERPDFLAEKTGTACVALSADGTAIVAAKPRVRVERILVITSRLSVDIFHNSAHSLPDRSVLRHANSCGSRNEFTDDRSALSLSKNTITDALRQECAAFGSDESWLNKNNRNFDFKQYLPLKLLRPEQSC